MAKSKSSPTAARAKAGALAAVRATSASKPRAIPSVKPPPLASMLAAAGLAAPKPPLPATAILNQEVALEQVLTLLSRLPDPDLVIDQLGMSRADLRKLETDDEISAALETRREAVIATPWRLEPAEGEPVQWLHETLAPHVESLLRGAWTALPYGYSVQEVIYRPDPTRGARGIGLERVVDKPLEWFEPRRDGSLWYTPPTGLGSGVPVPVDTQVKFLLTRRSPTYRNPYGEALLSRCYWPWFFRHNGWRFWMRFIERFAEPLLLGQVFDPQGFIAAMRAMGLEAVVGVGKEETIQAITPGTAGEFEKLELALSRRIQKLILGQTLTSDVAGSGSYAAAQVHNEVRQDKRNADLRLVSGTVQRLVEALWALNALPGPAPRFVLADDTGLETARAERDAKLVQAGVLRFTESYLLDRYDFVPGDFIVPDGTASGQGVGASPGGGEGANPGAGQDTGQADGTGASARTLTRLSLTTGQGKSASLAVPQGTKAQRFTPDQELVESLVAAALAQAASPIPAAAVRSAILAAEGPDDLAARLAELYAGQDAAAFQELLERSLFAADVLGYATAQKRVGV